MPYEEYFKAATEGLIVVDRKGQIVETNPAAERLFGYSGAELVGQPIDLLVPAEIRELHARHVESYLRAPRTRPMGLQAVPLAAYCVGCQAQRNTTVCSGEGSIDEASSKLWVKPAEMDESVEAQDALVEPEEQLFVHDQKPFGTELGEFEQLPPVATARRRGRLKKHDRGQ